MTPRRRRRIALQVRIFCIATLTSVIPALNIGENHGPGTRRVDRANKFTPIVLLIELK